MQETSLRFVDTEFLHLAYLEDGPPTGRPVVLVHGFPYDVHAFDEVAARLVAHGSRVIRPYVRGFGPTRFRSDDILRSGQQAARAVDLIQLVRALRLERPVIGGFDWGGNAACAAAASWPRELGGLVSYAGYDVIDIDAQRLSPGPSLEQVCWYQHLFQTPRGARCLEEHRADLCLALWRQWSPHWTFDAATYALSAASFDNPDFVDVVIHAYRFMFGRADGDPRFDELEASLATSPAIAVPTVTIDGTADPLKPGGTAHHARFFVGRHAHRVVEGAGHNVPQERPEVFAEAVATVQGWRA